MFMSASLVTRNLPPDGDFPNYDDDQHHQVAEEWDSVVCEVRQVEGFSRFPLPPLYSDLQQAAIEGPVVVINASECPCDAVIILRNDPPHHVPLSNITLQDDTQLESEFAHGLKNRSNSSVPGHENSRRKQLFSRLRSLWDLVMYPIVHGLGNIQVPVASRIWFCPTSKFTSLPLHAAGPYRKGELRLSDLCITSYTKQAALDDLCQNSWFCLACHDKQATTRAFDSCFSMHDKLLSLLDIIRADISHPEFAFLSACHTAVRDAKTPDEVIHLAAGMQFAGFKSVIGTCQSSRGRHQRTFYNNPESGRTAASACGSPHLG